METRSKIIVHGIISSLPDTLLHKLRGTLPLLDISYCNSGGTNVDKPQARFGNSRSILYSPFCRLLKHIRIIVSCMKGVTAVCPRPQSSYIRHGVNNNDNTVSRWRQGYLLTITNTQDHQDPLLLPDFLLLLSSSVITTNQCCLGAFHSLIP